MEMQEAAFTTLLGSAEKAKTLLKELKTFAAKTPFALGDLTNSTRTLIGFGIESEKAVEIMKQIGDIAQGNGPKLQSLSLAFAQASSTGKLMGQDLLQMINVGFNPLLQISEDTGKSIAELKVEMSKGAISVEMLESAFANATKEGGRFFGGMELASQTLTGQVSTLLDTVVEMARSFGEGMLPAIKDTTVAITRITERFTDLDDGTKKFIITAGLAAAAIGPLLIGVGKLIPLVKALRVNLIKLHAVLLANPWILVATAIVAVTTAIVIFTAKARAAKTVQAQLADELEKGADAAERQRAALDDMASAQIRFIKAGGSLLEAIAIENKARRAGVSIAEALEEAIRSLIAAKEDEADTDNLSGQERFKKAQDALNAEIALIEDRAEIAKTTGEEINVVEEKRAALLEQVQLLQEDGFRLSEAENNNIRVLLEDNEELIEAWEEQIALLEEKRELEIEEMEAAQAAAELSAEAAQAARELATQEAANFDTRVDFHLATLSQQDQEVAAIRRQVAVFRSAGVDKEAANDWATTEINKINQKFHDAEIARIEDVSNANITQATEIVDMLGTVIKASEQGALDVGLAWAGMVADLAIASGDATALAVGAAIKLVVGIIEVVDFVVNYVENQTEKLAAVELDIGNRLRKMQLDAELANNKKILDDKLKIIDAAEQAALEAAGVAEKTRLELAREKLAKEGAELSAEERAELESEVTRLEIIEEFEERRLQAIETAAKEERRIKRELAIFNKGIAVAQAKVDRSTAEASLGIFASKSQKQEIQALYGELISAIQAVPLPALAHGGIIPPRPGGTKVIAAEAGVPEVFFPLDKLGSVLAQLPGPGGESGGSEEMMRVIVNLDGQPILDTVAKATRNRTLLIDAGSVV